MAATVDSENKSTALININGQSKLDNFSTSSTVDAADNNSFQEIFETFGGYDVDELYTLAIQFIREKEGKAFQIPYKDKLFLVAYYQQVTHGQFSEAKATPLGYFDVIGSDRRKTWQSLGNMSQMDAKINFIKLLHNICQLFRPFVLAHKCHLEDEKRRKEEEERDRKEEEMQRLEEEKCQEDEEGKRKEDKEPVKQNHQKRLIQEALNRQTFPQFKAYAEKQYPGDPEQQAVLIRQLQEQHYQQYMQQVLEEQLARAPKNSTSTNTPSPPKSNPIQFNNNPVDMSEVENPRDGSQESSNEASEEDLSDHMPIPAPNMWTRKDIVEFKEAIRKDGGDGIIKVGHGETVTVRVPTHSDGTCLVWEFATDNYDIGFGVFFEWTKSPDAAVTVHISESEDEDEEDDDLDQIHQDIEKGVSLSDRPPISSIVPIYRRDCHEDVYAGSHSYPGQGVYLLKFDNSYSLWRSKTLYYRVYYTH